MLIRGGSHWPVRAAVAVVVGLCSGGAVPTAIGAVGSPNGSIVFTADDAPAVSGDVYSLSMGGTLKDLTPTPFQETQPVVSPNGKWVAFLSDRGVGQSLLRIWVVGVDGSGLRPLSSPLPYATTFVWSPDSRTLAADTGGGTIYLLQPGHAQRLVFRDSYANSGTLSWSPDGRLLTYEGTSRYPLGVTAVTTAGKVVWQRPATGSYAWSTKGDVAIPSNGGIQIDDAQGHLLMRVPGRAVAWSPGGDEVATAFGGRLQVRTLKGRLVFDQPVAGLSKAQPPELVWVHGEDIVVTGLTSVTGATGMDLATRRPFAASEREVFSSNGLIAFTKQEGTAFALQVSTTAGTDVRTVGRVAGCLDDGGNGPALASLQFTPNGRSLLYQSNCSEPFANLWTVAPDGTHLRRLTSKQEEEAGPAWSPDGSTIAFSWSQYTGLSCKGCADDLYLVNDDGTDERALTSGTDGEFDTNPSWAPDGKTILYEHGTFDSLDIYEIPAGGGKPLDLHIGGEDPAWGPTRIAYVNVSKAPSAIWTAAQDGSDRQKIAAGNVTSPEWSSSGELAWLQEPAQGGHPWIETATGVHVALPFVNVRAFAWSPDGKQFVLAAQKPDTATYDVYTMATNGTAVRRLTHNVDASGVSWRR